MCSYITVFLDSQYAYPAPPTPKYDSHMPEYVRREWFYEHNGSIFPNYSPSPFNPLSTSDASKTPMGGQKFVNSSTRSVNFEGSSTYTSSPGIDSQTSGKQNEARGMSQTVHVIPETLVTGAVNVASSAINTARSVLNMIVPPKEKVSQRGTTFSSVLCIVTCNNKNRVLKLDASLNLFVL